MAHTQTHRSTLGVPGHSTLENRRQCICSAENESSLSAFMVCVGRSQAVSIQVHYCRSRAMAGLDQEDRSVLGRTRMGVEGYEHP